MEVVASLTALLRESEEPFWSSLRQALRNQDVQPDHAALAERCEQGNGSEFGVVVTADGEVFQFSILSEAHDFAEWIRMTDWWPSSPYRNSIEAALTLLKT